jgi:hypothetical protein
MQRIGLHPEIEALADSLFLPGFFDVDPRQLSKKNKRDHTSEPARGMRPGQKPLLSGRDFVLPELVQHAENGDLSVFVVESIDEVKLQQIFRLAEQSEEPPPKFEDLPHTEIQLERRRYIDYLKRAPRKEADRIARAEEFATWRMAGPDAESNFRLWWDRKQRRKKNALIRKANRLANCGMCGRRMDCRDHPDHVFYEEFGCGTRYCRGCGERIFASLFGKYIGLWPTVQTLLPPNGFRSKVVIAALDFTAVNLHRMPKPEEIREFNEDVHECVLRTMKELGIAASEYGFLWCDEFGGWSPKKRAYNTNLHAHGVYVGPPLPQQILAQEWAKIRAEKDGAKIVWIKKQKLDRQAGSFLEGERHRFVRALGHALKYTGKHVLRSDACRLAELEVAFHTVRRTHTMGLFYHADLDCQWQCSHCDSACGLVNGHQGEHRCKFHGHENRCPLCDGYLMFPRESGYAAITDLKKEGRRNLGEVRREIARNRIFQLARAPDAAVPNAA